MASFATKSLPLSADVIAPDGSDVRILAGLERGSMAHFALAPGETATAITHRTADEIWYFLTGAGQMWREQESRTEIVDLRPGLSLTIPVGTRFQFRAFGDEVLTAIAVTMPPWPGEDEAVIVTGPWQPTVPR